MRAPLRSDLFCQSLSANLAVRKQRNNAEEDSNRAEGSNGPEGVMTWRFLIGRLSVSPWPRLGQLGESWHDPSANECIDL